MPGEFYIEGKKENETIEQLHGEEPVTGSAASDWQAAEADVVSIGEEGVTKVVLDAIASRPAL